MTTPRPFRFGIQMWESTSGEEWREKARKAEALGFDILVIPDHFPGASGGAVAFAPALAAAASVTTALRIGTNVLDNDFRHPALVAADAAMLDVLSDGRFELGIGAGWMTDDYARSGIPFDRPGIRLQRLEESVHILKQYFAPGSVMFSGKHYTINGIEGYPKPVQQPHPPILIGAASPRITAFAAREADIISVMARVLPPQEPIYADLTTAGVDEKVRWIRAAAGTRFEAIELNVLMQRVVVTADRQGAATSLGQEWQITPPEARESPYALIGTVQEIGESLRVIRARHGIAYFTFFERHLDAIAPVIAQLAGT